MNQDSVKNLLLDIEDSRLDFSVTFTGKASKKVNGLYKPESREILLHNKNFTTDNQLVYTAIHEYAHHLLCEEQLEKNAGLAPMKYSRVHTSEFWARFHGLLEKAEAKGVYTMTLEESPELAQLTEELRKNYLEQNGRLMAEFGRLLIKAHKLCEEAHIRYEDYVDRVLKLPRNTAKAIAKISTVEVNPAIGFENMKLVASLPTPEKRSEAEQQILAGKSPDSVRAGMKKKAEETDARTRLEKEKQRLEKTIAQLSSRLELVQESLANL